MVYDPKDYDPNKHGIPNRKNYPNTRKGDKQYKQAIDTWRNTLDVL